MTEKYKVKRGQIRRAEIAKTAEHVFLEHGYAQTTMQMVAQSAGASKETLYRHFGTKEGLFTEIVRSRSARIAVELDVDINLNESPDNVVFAIAHRILKILSSKDVVRFYSWVIAETRRTPELGRIFYELGPAISREKFRTFLEEAKGQGSFSCDDTMLATRLFFGSLTSEFLFLPLVIESKKEKEAEESEILEYANGTAAMFLARYGHT